MKKLIIFILIYPVFIYIFADVIVVKRDNVMLKNGPGVYYQTISTLSKDSGVNVLQYTFKDFDSDQWIRVKCNQSKLEGFISKSSVSERKVKSDFFTFLRQNDLFEKSQNKIIPNDIRSIGIYFSEKFNGNREFIDFANAYRTDINSYNDFKNDTYIGFPLRQNRSTVNIPVRDTDSFFTDTETGLGLGLASVISNKGLYYNRIIQNYVNHIGLLLIEAYDITDVEFKFFILNIDEPDTFSGPGGFVFITKGMLLLCENEAELSVVLAKEIAHVMSNQMFRNITNNQQSLIFDKKETLTDSIFLHKKMNTLNELEDDYNDFLLSSLNGNFLNDNMQNNLTAILISARAGYDSHSYLNLLNRVLNRYNDSGNYNTQKSLIELKIEQAEKLFNDIKLPNNLMDKSYRYQIFKNQIR